MSSSVNAGILGDLSGGKRPALPILRCLSDFEFQPTHIFRCPGKTPNLGTRDSHTQRISNFGSTATIHLYEGTFPRPRPLEQLFCWSPPTLPMWCCLVAVFSLEVILHSK